MKTGKLLLALLLASTAPAGCNDETTPDRETDDFGHIQVPDRRQLIQNLGADAATGSVAFTTDGAWSSTLRQTRAEAPDWLTIAPDHGDRAGEYTVTLTLQANDSDSDRAAKITIVCGDDRIEIDVTQQASGKQDPVPLPTPTPKNRVVRIDWADNYASADVSGSALLTYDAAGRLTSYDTPDVIRTDFVYDNDKLTGTSTIHDLEDGTTEIQQLGFDASWCMTLSREQTAAYTLTTTCTYDAEGHIAQEVSRMTPTDPDAPDAQNYTATWTSTYTWADGNLIRIDEMENDRFAGTTTFEYTTDENPFAETWVDPVLLPHRDYMGLGLRGRHSRNMVKRIVSTFEEETPETTAFAYGFDADGRLTNCEAINGTGIPCKYAYTYAE